jgi:Domain of unknown function (DUF6468)
MSGLPVGLILELVVVALLSVTVGYCFVLNRRLKRLRSAQDDMRMVIQDLNRATQTAENAISGLRITAEDAERKLGEKLHKAKLLTHNLALFVEHGANNDVSQGDQNDNEWRQAG